MILGKTMSVCPICLHTIPAQKTVKEDGYIYLEKTCPEHGSFSALIWEGCTSSYTSWDKNSIVMEPPVHPKTAISGCPHDCGLCENHLRKGCCMLLELTNRCNLHCPVCFASAGEQNPCDISMKEIEKQYDFLMSHGGPFNIQLSGGEPTMRDDLPEIIRLGRQKGFTFFQLNTNGLRLAEDFSYTKSLKESGLNTVFLQFDGVSDDVYTILRGRALLAEKKKAIANCAKAGLGVVLVPVIAPGVNEHQIGAILDFALAQMPWIRGVHFQPISYFGRCDVSAPDKPVHITIPRMLRHIEAQMHGLMKRADFGSGGAENPYCSFHASYMRKPDGTLKALAQKSSQCCCTTSDDSRTFVANQWTGVDTPDSKEECCCCDSGTENTCETSCCCDSSEYNAENSCYDESSCTETSSQTTDWTSFDDFLEHARQNTFTVSGMIFQDCYNLDLDRLRRCYICEVDSNFGMVPFCAYNLTDINGRSLYRS